MSSRLLLPIVIAAVLFEKLSINLSDVLQGWARSETVVHTSGAIWIQVSWIKMQNSALRKLCENNAFYRHSLRVATACRQYCKHCNATEQCIKLFFVTNQIIFIRKKTKLFITFEEARVFRVLSSMSFFTQQDQQCLLCVTRVC